MAMLSLRRRAFIATSCAAVVVGCGTEPVDNTPAAISIAVSVPTIYEGDTVRFTASVTNARGAVVGAQVSWKSSDPARLSIDGAGLATVLAGPPWNGTYDVAVTASAAAISNARSVTISWRAPFEVWPDTNVLIVGATRALKARLINRQTSVDPVPTETEASWSSLDASVASVDASGSVTARAVGQVRIIAKKGSQADTAEVYVRAPSAPLHFVEASGSVGVFVTENGEPKTAPHGCGLTDTGDVYCWGLAMDAGAPTDRCESKVRVGPSYFVLRHFRCSELPYKLSSPVAFTTIAARGDMGCGIAISRRVYCWGSTGIVAPIASTDEFISIHVPSVSAALYDSAPTCGLRTDRVLVCWGSTPTAVGTMTWRSFAGASRCGIGSDSAAYCLVGTTPQRVGTNSGWAAISTSGPASYPSPGQNSLSRLCVTDFSGQALCGGTATSAFTAVAGVPAVTAIDMFGIKASDQCGLNQSGDLHCFFEATTADRKIDLGGVKLKKFFGTCGIATDDKVYCWTQDPATGAVAFRKIAGQQ